MKKPLSIGVDNYKEMIDKSYYYVDKTLLIKEILDKRGKVNLFTRPRRFGKTLALSMLRAFFEQERKQDGQYMDNGRYFEGKKIMKAGEYYTRCMGTYPVISLSLKSAKQPDFEMAYSCLIEEISREYDRHRYVLEGTAISAADKEKFRMVWGRKAQAADYATALEFLSFCLEKYHGMRAIILIDEYDVPLENAYFENFYPKMIKFIRSLFESALKTNESLEFAVITGCLRISKESIFTGLNNLKILSILNDSYAEYFGFTPPEVEEMMDFYKIQEKKEEVRLWYDGYLFGKTEVYNPWSVINYVDEITSMDTWYPKPYWSNTSSNAIVRELIEGAGQEQKQQLEALIGGGRIEIPVYEDITYEDIHKTQDNLWNFLFFTGYLKAQSSRFTENRVYITLSLPNEEIKYIYQNTVMEWFEQRLRKIDLSRLYHAVTEGEEETFAMEVTKQLGETISFFDYAENYYYGFLTGLLKGCPGFIIKSNRESGNGRPDLLMHTVSVRGMAILMELKLVKRFDQMETGCESALEQIKNRSYEAGLYQEGFRNILKYGVCFYRKECLVKKMV